MHAGLIDKLGEEVADVLVDHLPPVGWADVATKTDVQHLGEVLSLKIDGEIAEVRGEIATLRAEFYEAIARQTRTLMISMVGGFATIAGAAFGALAALPH